MNKSKLFTTAHKIAKTLEGDYRARFAYALSKTWKEIKMVNTNMVINHKILGNIEVSVSKNNVEMVIQGNKLTARAEKRKENFVLVFSKEIKIKESAKNINGLNITKDEHNLIKQIMFDIKEREYQKEYAEWIDKKASYNTSYKFGSFANKFSNEAQKNVSKNLDAINTDLDDYSVTYYYNTTNKDVMELLKIEEIRLKKIKEEKNNKEKNRIKVIFETAKKTGEKQVICTYSEPCNDPKEECDIDIITEYALPCGNIQIVRNHTW